MSTSTSGSSTFSTFASALGGAALGAPEALGAAAAADLSLSAWGKEMPEAKEAQARFLKALMIEW